MKLTIVQKHILEELKGGCKIRVYYPYGTKSWKHIHLVDSNLKVKESRIFNQKTFKNLLENKLLFLELEEKDFATEYYLISKKGLEQLL